MGQPMGPGFQGIVAEVFSFANQGEGAGSGVALPFEKVMQTFGNLEPGRGNFGGRDLASPFDRTQGNLFLAPHSESRRCLVHGKRC